MLKKFDNNVNLVKGGRAYSGTGEIIIFLRNRLKKQGMEKIYIYERSSDRNVRAGTSCPFKG